jgi:F-type H+-transporting ATPase subunit b
MELVTPGIGLLFWMVICFGILLFILKKFVWKPLLSSIIQREKYIDESLVAADKAKEELANIKTEGEKILDEAKRQKNDIIAEGEKTKEKIIENAKKEAKDESNRLISKAKEMIKSERSKTLSEIKAKIADFSVEIAEKIIRQELTKDKEQKAYIQKMIEETKLN